MEDLNLTETEMRYFGDLFLCCDEESNGKIPILKATELFRSSNVHNDVLKQIMDISVAPNNCASLSHMNRKQFYSALKLIAAHQTNMTVKPELLSTSVDLPLPRFTWALNSEANADLIQLSNSPHDHQHHLSKRERNFGGTLGAYEPIRLSSNLSDSDVPQVLSHDTTEGLSTDSEIESETLSQRSGSRGRRGPKTGSPWSTASESPTPTNSVAERVHPVWEHSATGRGVWPANTGEEHTRLLGTEEESSDRHSSEEEGDAVDDIWAISDAQARHYAGQFATLRPERGMLSGQTARLFFEKSHLPVPDLRKIWQLSDINKDGMLTLEEFSIAMHLIVLRRNNVPVPEALPSALVPRVDSRYSAQAVTTDLVDLGADMFSSGTSADFNFAPKTEPIDPYDATKAVPKKPEERQASLTPPKTEAQVNNKEWTKFVDSPTSSVSSPGPKPVNFDFHKSAVERDPKIFHPVAVRVTPDNNALPLESDTRASTSPRRDDFAHAFELASPKRLNSQPPAEPPPNGAEIKSIQRPQPRKPVKPVGVLPPPPARDDGPASLQYAPKKEPPPPPPPRPLRNHARSSSLDLNRLKGAPAPPPQPPPRASPSTAEPPRRLINQRSEGEPAFPPDAFAPREYDEGLGYVREMHGAFEVYRKPRDSSPEPDVRALSEQNAVLHRVCRALCSELADVTRDREALRVRLDHATLL